MWTGHLFGIAAAAELFHQNHKPGRLARERLRGFGKLFGLRGVSLRDPVDLRHGSVHLVHAELCSADAIAIWATIWPMFLTDFTISARAWPERSTSWVPFSSLVIES